MKYIKLLAPAVVIPAAAGTGAVALGTGSIVGVGTDLPPVRAEREPLVPHEVPVAYIGPSRKPERGWLTPNALKSSIGISSKNTLRTEWFDPVTDRLSAWDQLRERIAATELTARSWFCRCIGVDEDKLADVRAVIREFGGRNAPTDDRDTSIRRAIRLITGEDITMAAVAEEREETETPKRRKGKGGKKAKVKAGKKAKARDVEASNGAGTLGERLTSLLKTKEGKTLAKAVAAGSASKKQLTSLRDLINEEASAAREAEDGTRASELSSANRLVRRLQRQA